MDSLLKYHEFAKMVAAVVPPPPEDGYHYAVMIMVHTPGGMPVGGALNFVNGKWEVQAEMGEVTPVVG